jgi:hypothetical protein
MLKRNSKRPQPRFTSAPEISRYPPAIPATISGQPSAILLLTKAKSIGLAVYAPKGLRNGPAQLTLSSCSRTLP